MLHKKKKTLVNNTAAFNPRSQINLYKRPQCINQRGLKQLTNNMIQIINYYNEEKNNDDDDDDDDYDYESNENDDVDDYNPR